MTKQDCRVADGVAECSHTRPCRGLWSDWSSGGEPGTAAEAYQVWSLIQYYSVDFSKSRIGVKKCVFNKRTIKVCVSCC